MSPENIPRFEYQRPKIGSAGQPYEEPTEDAGRKERVFREFQDFGDDGEVLPDRADIGEAAARDALNQQLEGGDSIFRDYWAPGPSDKRKPYRDRLPITLTVVAMLGIVAAVWACDPATPQTALHEPLLGHCYPYRVVVATLFAKYQEVSTGRTLVEQTGTAVEVFISPKGTFSVVEVLPDDLTCYRAFSSPGEFWGAPPRNMVPA